MASCRSSLESDMLSIVTKDVHWPHRSFRDSVQGVHKWLADVTLSFQALQATPQVAGFIPNAPGHKILNRLHPFREIPGHL